MTLRQKFIFAGATALLAAAMAPVAWLALGRGGYFYAGRCVCGHDCYVRIRGDRYFSYSPGHEVPEYRKFALRHTADGWDVMGLPHSDVNWSPLEGENKVIGRLHFRDGALYESWGGCTNWTRLPRAHDVWRVWAASS